MALRPPPLRHRALENCLHELGTPAGGWMVPTRRADAWQTAYVAGTAEDASFPRALLGCSTTVRVHVFDPALDHLWTDAPPPLRLHLHREKLHVARAMRELGHQRLDLLAVHDTAAVGEIVGEVVQEQIDVRVLCLATLGEARDEDVDALWNEMRRIGFSLAHAAADGSGWRMVFET